jgi:hypothetical protein
VLEESKNYPNVKHVNVEKTVEALSEAIKQDGGAELLAREGEINRVGMVIRQVQESTQATLTSMKAEYKLEKKDDRDLNVTYFRVVFAKK